MLAVRDTISYAATSSKCFRSTTSSELQDLPEVPCSPRISVVSSDPSHKVTFHDGQRDVVHEFYVLEDQYILHRAEAQDISLPFACRHAPIQNVRYFYKFPMGMKMFKPKMITPMSQLQGHYMLGLALIQRQKYAEGIKALERSLDLGRAANPGGYLVEDIWQELARAKYQQWEHHSTQRSWDLQNLKDSCEIALVEKHSRDVTQVEGFTDEITDSASQPLQALNYVFSKASLHDTPTEIPEYLCCRITLGIFRDPVIAPSGISYERAVILDHLHKFFFINNINLKLSKKVYEE